MPLIEFSKLTDAQKAEVYAMYPPPWSAGPYEWWAFWIKPDGHLTRAKGRHVLTAHGYEAWQRQEFNKPSHAHPEKGDLACWKPGTIFHFSRN